MTATEYLAWGIVAHIVADWFLQNDYQAVGKTEWPNTFPGHLHCWCHLACLWCVFPIGVAGILAVVHAWIDTRKPLQWYRAKLGQAKEGNPVAVHIAIWQDQAAHVLCIAVAALLIGM